jgi:hypothetical protein
MLPATTARVPEHTSDAVNESIREATERSVAHHFVQGPAAVERRLEELEREWDIERTLEANAATVSLLGLLAGATIDRRFYLLPAAVAGFLLQHALQGWCPPVPVFRRLGFRTAAEIAEEKFALKALRGDFRGVPVATAGHGGGAAHEAIEAVRR